MLFILHKTIDDPLDRYLLQTFWVFLRDKIKILGQNRHYDIDLFKWLLRQTLFAVCWPWHVMWLFWPQIHLTVHELCHICILISDKWRSALWMLYACRCVVQTVRGDSHICKVHLGVTHWICTTWWPPFLFLRKDCGSNGYKEQVVTTWLTIWIRGTVEKTLELCSLFHTTY